MVGLRKPAPRSREEVSALYEKHADMVYRVCFAYLKNASDTEDAVQETFLRLLRSGPAFDNGEHEKAWLIVTASNVCRDAFRHWWRKRESLEDHWELSDPEQPETDETLDAVLALPDRYKAAVYLHYYEGYSSADIAAMLKKPSSTIRTYLQKGRALLREKLGGELE